MKARAAVDQSSSAIEWQPPLSATTADYTKPSGKLTIPAGRSSGTITIKTTVDDVLELNGESLIVELTSATTAAGTVTANTATPAVEDRTTTIRDHDGTVVVSVADAPRVDEGGVATFTVSLSGTVSRPVTVTVTPSGNPDDYDYAERMLTIAAGETSKTVRVETKDDMLAEDEETFTLTISGALPEGVVYGANTAIGTIRDNDPLQVNLSGPRAVASDAPNARIHRGTLWRHQQRRRNHRLFLRSGRLTVAHRDHHTRCRSVEDHHYGDQLE